MESFARPADAGSCLEALLLGIVLEDLELATVMADALKNLHHDLDKAVVEECLVEVYVSKVSLAVFCLPAGLALQA